MTACLTSRIAPSLRRWCKDRRLAAAGVPLLLAFAAPAAAQRAASPFTEPPLPPAPPLAPCQALGQPGCTPQPGLFLDALRDAVQASQDGTVQTGDVRRALDGLGALGVEPGSLGAFWEAAGRRDADSRGRGLRAAFRRVAQLTALVAARPAVRAPAYGAPAPPVWGTPFRAGSTPAVGPH